MANADSIVAPTQKPSFLGRIGRMWNRYRRRARARTLGHVRFRLTREGMHFTGILTFIFIGAVIREISLLILLAGAMIGLLILQWRFNTSTLLGLSVRRMLPRSTRVGKETDVEIRLTNPKSWLGAWLVQADDRVKQTTPIARRTPERGTVLVDQVRPQGTEKTSYRLQFFERGEYRLGPTVISTRFPLGLGVGWRTLDNLSTLLVHPKQGQLTSKLSQLLHLDQVGHAKSSSKSGNQEGEFFGLRPWASGDSKRWIHWRTTARLGQLSVCQYEQQQQRQITVILDLHQTAGSEAKKYQEMAVSFIATLASQTVSLAKDKIAIGLASSSSKTYPAIVSSLLVQSLLDELATIDAAEAPELLETFKGLSVPILSHPQVIVISTRANILQKLKDECSDSVTERLLSISRIRWIDVTQGELEPYFQWT